jgi:hypothetical protein
MRSLVAGIVGGVSGGGTVLLAAVLLSIEGRAMVGGDGELAFARGQDASPTPNHPPAIDTPPSVTTSTTDPLPSTVSSEWVMPALLVEEFQFIRPSVAATQPPIAAATSRVAASTVAVVEPVSAITHPEVTIPIADVEPVAPSATGKADATCAAEAAGSAGDPEARPSLAASVLPDPPVAQAIPAPPVREPAELRALRSFRLSVPKELPKVDLAYPAALNSNTAGSPGIDQDPSSRPPATPVRIPFSPARQAEASSPSTGMANSIPLTTQTPSSPSPTISAAATEAQSGKDSLMRASDAVKRLSRRMGGRYGR